METCNENFAINQLPFLKMSKEYCQFVIRFVESS